MIIGITGGTGCGKTTALQVIRDLGGVIIDCDAVYHQLLQTDTALLQAIETRFPGTVVGGNLQRKVLGSIVFADPRALEDLNKITHGAVKQSVLAILNDEPKLAAIDAIGLFEGGLAPLCDVTVAITAPEEARIARLQVRDEISREYAVSRIRAQKNADYFKANCDYVLENDRTEADFREKCLAFFSKLIIMKSEYPKKETLL